MLSAKTKERQRAARLANGIKSRKRQFPEFEEILSDGTFYTIRNYCKIHGDIIIKEDYFNYIYKTNNIKEKCYCNKCCEDIINNFIPTENDINFNIEILKKFTHSQLGENTIKMYYPKLYKCIISFNNYYENFKKEISFSQKIYIFKNNIKEIPKCKCKDCENEVNFYKFGNNYNKLCELHSISKNITTRKGLKNNYTIVGKEHFYEYKNLEKINIFKNNKTLENYSNILDDIDDIIKCKYCNKHIFYNNDTYILYRNRLKCFEIKGKHFKTKKGEYKLVVCEKCLIEKFPEWNDKNKNKVFNQPNEISKFAFDISDEDFNKAKNKYVVRNLENFVEKYGKEEGQIRYNLFKEKTLNFQGFSKISQEFFKKLDEYFTNYETFYHDKNKEYFINIKNENFYLLDYYIKDLNLCIEYNGSNFHADPTVYKENDIVLNFTGAPPITAKEIWEKDKNRINNLKTFRDIDTIIIWDNVYNRKNKNFDFEKFANEIKIKYDK